jgi:hypothetical protein
VLAKSIEAKLISIIAWGGFFATILVTDKLTNEPYNLGKMVVIASLAGGCFGLLVQSPLKIFVENKLVSVVIGSFLLSFVFSMILSESPFERSLYGAYGRNTGLLTYLSLSLIFFGSTLIKSIEGIQKFIYCLALAGVINASITFFDRFNISVFSVTNPYGLSSGTLGNPNFLGSFLAMTFPIFLAYSIYFRKISRVRFIFLVGAMFMVLHGVESSGAMQGYLLIVFGTSLVLWFYIRATFNSKLLQVCYTLIGMLVGVLGILGVFNLGPMAKILHKPSITFRGEYWLAGINMAKDNFFLGLGPDSYGLYYREFRNESATRIPGLNVTTDTAHNVMIDIFSGVGIFAIVTYFAIIAISVASIQRVIRRGTNFDPIFVSLVGAWSCYQIQSIFSINQIGVAVWGWVLSGALIAYSRIKPNEISKDKRPTFQKKSFNDKEIRKPELIPAKSLISMVVAIMAGLAISTPPLFVDAKVRNTLSSKPNLNQVEALAYLWPRDTARYEKITITLANAGYTTEATKVSKEGARLFPMDYRNWYALLMLAPDNSPERVIYLSKLRELDPFNTELK